MSSLLKVALLLAAVGGARVAGSTPPASNDTSPANECLDLQLPWADYQHGMLLTRDENCPSKTDDPETRAEKLSNASNDVTWCNVQGHELCRYCLYDPNLFDAAFPNATRIGDSPPDLPSLLNSTEEIEEPGSPTAVNATEPIVTPRACTCAEARAAYVEMEGCRPLSEEGRPEPEFTGEDFGLAADAPFQCMLPSVDVPPWNETDYITVLPNVYIDDPLPIVRCVELMDVGPMAIGLGIEFDPRCPTDPSTVAELLGGCGATFRPLCRDCLLDRDLYVEHLESVTPEGELSPVNVPGLQPCSCCTRLMASLLWPEGVEAGSCTKDIPEKYLSFLTNPPAPSPSEETAAPLTGGLETAAPAMLDGMETAAPAVGTTGGTISADSVYDDVPWAGEDDDNDKASDDDAASDSGDEGGEGGEDGEDGEDGESDDEDEQTRAASSGALAMAALLTVSDARFVLLGHVILAAAVAWAAAALGTSFSSFTSAP